MAQKAIGPTFDAELQAALTAIGKTTDGVAWQADGTITFSTSDQAVISATEAVYAAHDPTKTS